MNRRQLLCAAPSAALLALACPPVSASDLEPVTYSREAYEQALANGEPLLLDFYAWW